MTHTIGLGDYAIGIGYDESLNVFVGEVVNVPYSVRLTADSEDDLRRRFERLLSGYMGLKTA